MTFTSYFKIVAMYYVQGQLNAFNAVMTLIYTTDPSGFDCELLLVFSSLSYVRTQLCNYVVTYVRIAMYVRSYVHSLV